MDLPLEAFSHFRSNIRRNGEVELGSEVGCDGGTKKKYHVITHAHADHLGGLSTGQHQVATPQTIDIISAIKGSLKHPLPLEYGVPLELERGKLFLYPANHILGAAQVMVETPDGSFAFTGDFKLKGTPVLHPDELVIEATYGSPNNVRDYVNADLILRDLVEQGLARGSVDIYASQGKLQEILSILSYLPRWVSVIMDNKSYEIAKIYEKYGVRFPKYYKITSREALAEIREKNPYVALWPLSTARNPKNMSLIVTGWAGKALKQIGKTTFMVGLSDHADFNELVYYVDESRARWVITDAHRSQLAKTLARELEKKLHVNAVARP
ncbi:MBL fold metallo-hydrolase [Tardisphaera miroshnichenkoae]